MLKDEEPQLTLDLLLCFDVTEKVLRKVFAPLYLQKVKLEGLILKPNMIIPGLSCSKQATVTEVADATVNCLMQAVPTAIGGIAFLSGGHSGELASADLNAMHVRLKSALPWPLPFSFARAIHQSAINIWRSEDVNIFAATSSIPQRLNVISMEKI